ncbi:MAG: MCP four helix bundle domain-containing protein [Rhizobiales bacterium]|nr:MCP four helix bundle domain-containing protein [Rhizobacter sp.]
MPIRPQLYAAFGLVLVLTAAVGAISLTSLARVDKQVHTMSDKWLRGVGLLAEMRGALIETREFEIKHGRTADGSYHAEYEEKMAAATQLVASTLAAYEGLAETDAERAMLAKFGKGWAAYQQSAKRVVSLGREKKQQDAADISDGAASMSFDETLGALNTMTKNDFAGGQSAATVTNEISAQARLLVIGLSTGALCAGMVLAWLITRHLLRQLGTEPSTASALARSVAEGDLSTHITLRKGDTDSLMAQLQTMQRKLAAAVTDVRRGSENVATASAQIAQGNQDLSNRTEQQASALQETAATMDQLGATVRNNADNARQANQLAQGASGVAVKGGTVVGQVVETMKRINDSSKQIADIISVIDGIAFQTNILALNAAVEAARAGEQGRGFAVVASEVRSLAQRSAGAAKEIKGLINASVERVEQGTALVDQAGHTMVEIVAAIKRVTDIVAEISAASSEQSSGVAQVGQAISQMDQATQQNAALVEESAAAAESMSQQAQQLVGAVAVFKLQAA